MKLLDVRVQGEDIPGVRRLRLLQGTPVAELKALARLLRRRDTRDPLYLFAEDEEQPLGDERALVGTVLNAHLHRCRHIAVTCRGPDWELLRCLTPSTRFATVAELLAQAGHPASASGGLYLAGTQTLAEPARHLGGFVHFPFCQLNLDLRN